MVTMAPASGRCITGWTALVADLLIDPPRKVRRLIFFDDTSTTPKDPMMHRQHV
jgi:hypothetical protein